MRVFLNLIIGSLLLAFLGTAHAESHLKNIGQTIEDSITDAYITAKVEAAVLKAKVFDDESIPIVGINATTFNGIVTISGAVKSDQSLFAIIRRVNAVRGVKKIVSRLVVGKGEVT